MFEEKVKTWLEKNGFDNLDVIDDNAFVYIGLNSLCMNMA